MSNLSLETREEGGAVRIALSGEQTFDGARIAQVAECFGGGFANAKIFSIERF